MLDPKAMARHAYRRFSDREALRTAADLRRHFSTDPGALAYDGLTPLSLVVAGAEERPADSASVNLLLPEFNRRSVFAGIRTAVEFGMSLAAIVGAPLRVIALRNVARGSELQQLRDSFEKDFAGSIAKVGLASELARDGVAAGDIWIATHWTTAHALDVAARLGRIDPKQVVYLVQDYEPGFSAWSSEYALARSTYHAGFRLAVNSSPVANYLAMHDSLFVDPRFVFRPSLDLRRLEQVAEHRAKHGDGHARVLFYARPSKPRNLFSIGFSALQSAALELERRGAPAEFVTVGESHAMAAHGSLTSMRILGRLGWAKYFEVLGTAGVFLSLQHSPHPSHPPLDAVVSGATAVTNELSGTRGSIHPRLVAVEADPTSLARAIASAVEEHLGSPPAPFSPEVLESLGGDLHQVVQEVAAEVGI